MPWTGWQQLDGGYSGGIEAIGQNADGRLEVFGLQPAPGGQAAAHNWQTSPNNGWSGWTSLGSPPQNDVLSHLEVASNADGRLEIFLRYGAMSAGAMWHAWQTAPNNGWTGWAALNVSVGHVTSGPIVVTGNADGRMELFAIASPEGVTHAWQTAPNGGWSSQDSLGSPTGVLVQGLAAARNSGGQLLVVAQGSDGAIWAIAQTAPNNGWGSWTSLGKPASESLFGPAIASNADGRLEVFATGKTMWHTAQSTPGGTWSSWSSLGAPSGGAAITDLGVGQNADGRLEVFATVLNGDVWHIWQTAPSGTSWSGWDSLGGEPNNNVYVGSNQDGRLEIFVQGRTSGAGVYHRWQTTPGGVWS
jgi:hypothetical protein